MSQSVLFILGGAGFIGHETVTEAVKAGWQVKALVRSEEKAENIRQLGAQAVLGDIARPEGWANEARGARVLIDLVQPKLPRRLTRAAIQTVSTERQIITGKIIAALGSFPVEERPVLFSISGADDLQPDAQKRISHLSPLRKDPCGFAFIGIPIRKLIEQSGLDATYIYLGNIVYGPGKIFADRYVKALAKGAAFVVGQGTNHLPLSEVTDVARALVHLAGLPRPAIVQQTFLVMDGSTTTQRELLDETASLMGVKPARALPSWLAALVAGQIAVDTVTLEALANPSALLATGFRFDSPSHREGVPRALARMGYPPSAASQKRLAEDSSHT
ncbi:MAG: NAD(P)H-binding protein [Ktedonobacteraceae bacterium]|nr:NAD(P)H-binding protein [Ktedonobacteraceae bacterium]